MTDKEYKLLTDLPKKKLARGITREEALTSLVQSGILNRDGRFTEQYESLEKVVKRKECMK